MSFGSGYSHTTYHSSRPAFSVAGGRAKSVLDNHGVAHAWAHMGQDWGRSGNGNFYFEGATLYSYGSHFAVGYRLLAADGDRHGGFALMNANSYSVSTSGQQSDARGAVRHLTSYSVPDLTQIIDALPRKIGDALPEWKAKRLSDFIAAAIGKLDADAALFLLRLVKPAATSATVARMKATAERNAAKAKDATAKREHKALIEQGARLIEARKDSGFPARLAEMSRALRTMRGTPNPYDFNRYLKQLRACHKAASKSGYMARKAALWAIIKEVDGAMKAALSAHAAASRNAYTREKAKAFRDYSARHAAGTLSRSYDYQQFATACEWLLTHAPGISAARPAITQTRLDACARHAEILAIENAAAREKREREAAEKHEKQAATRAAWLAGTAPRSSGYGLVDSKGRALVRAVDVTRGAVPLEGGHGTAVLGITGGTLETSQGATVPLVDAIKVFRFVKLCRDRGQGWKRNGARLPVGGFQVDSIDKSGAFVAGCHSFSWEEIERLASLLGLADIAPLDTTTHA